MQIPLSGISLRKRRLVICPFMNMDPKRIFTREELISAGIKTVLKELNLSH